MHVYLLPLKTVALCQTQAGRRSRGITSLKETETLLDHAVPSLPSIIVPSHLD